MDNLHSLSCPYNTNENTLLILLTFTNSMVQVVSAAMRLFCSESATELRQTQGS